MPSAEAGQEAPVLKAAAFIVRSADGGGKELLAFRFASQPELPMRVPGGWLEGDENPENALLREVFEESGLEDLVILRKLGVARFFKDYIQRRVVRHDFLLTARGELPDSWQHHVTGKGGDAGEIFHYQWLAGTELEQLSYELQMHVTVDLIPELFESRTR